MDNKQYFWGIDLGGTKTEGVVFRMQPAFNVLARERILTERAKGYTHILSRIEKVVNLLKQKTGLNPAKIGIGTPGSYDFHLKEIKNSNTTVLNGKDLWTDLEERLDMPVLLANDANCFALSETILGAGKTLHVLPQAAFGIILGTGVGGGIVLNGNAVHGKHGIAGEWGHNFLDASGGKCYCGKTGCVETVISGPALEDYYFRLSKTKLSLKKITQLSQDGTDKHATATIDRLCYFFGKAVAVPLNILDPDVVIIGGGLSNIAALYKQGKEQVREHLFNHTLHTPFLSPQLGDSAGVFGAALLTAEKKQ